MAHDMHQFLSTGLPPEEMNRDERKRLAVQSRHFCLLQDTLYHKGADKIWQQAVQSNEKEAILREAHYRVIRGQYVGDATAWKIWWSGLWWPITLKDSVRFCKQCDLCQRMGQPQSKHGCRINWYCRWGNHSKNGGCIFVRPFKPPAMHTRNHHIIIATDYCTKWVKVKALRDNTTVSMVKFLYEYISVWMPNRVHKRPRQTLHRTSGGKFEDILGSGPQKDHVIKPTSERTRRID